MQSVLDKNKPFCLQTSSNTNTANLCRLHDSFRCRRSFQVYHMAYSLASGHVGHLCGPGYRSNSRVLLSKIRISISYSTWHKESTPWHCFLQYLVSHFKARCQLCRRRRYRRCDTCGVVRDDRVGIMITLRSCISALITTGRVLPICWVIHMCHRFDPFFFLPSEDWTRSFWVLFLIHQHHNDICQFFQN